MNSALRMCLLVVVALGVLVAAGCSEDPSGPGEPPAAAIDWQRCDFDSVMAAAAAAHQDMVVLVTANWCGSCNYLRDSSFAEPRVINLVSRHMTAFEVDLTNRDVPLCPGGPVIPDVLGEVRGIPVVFILRDGAIKSRLVGGRSPEALYAWLVESLLDR